MWVWEKEKCKWKWRIYLRKKNVQMNLEQISRLATQSQYQRRKSANELDCSPNVNIKKKKLKINQQTILDKRDW